MFQPRLVGLAALSLFALSACESNSSSELDVPQHGVLGVGASISGRMDDGSSYSLSVVERDVRLGVDGAVVFFLDGAPDGELRFDHDPEEARWRLDLPSGVVRCEGIRLEVAGEVYELSSDSNYVFDAGGRLQASETR